MTDEREAERSAGKVRGAAEREAQAAPHADRARRGAADREAAAASHVLTRRDLAKGHPPAQPPSKRR